MDEKNHSHKCEQSVRSSRRSQSFLWHREIATIPTVSSGWYLYLYFIDSLDSFIVLFFLFYVVGLVVSIIN